MDDNSLFTTCRELQNFIVEKLSALVQQNFIHKVQLENLRSVKLQFPTDNIIYLANFLKKFTYNTRGLSSHTAPN
jgi:hypothetical protein